MKTYQNIERGLKLTQNEVEALGWSDKDINTYLYGIHNYKTIDSFLNNRLNSEARCIVVRDIKRLQGLSQKDARRVFKDMDKDVRKDKINAALIQLHAKPKFAMTISRLEKMEDTAFHLEVIAQTPKKEAPAKKKVHIPVKGYIYVIINTYDPRYQYMVKVGRSKKPDARPGTFYLFDELSIAHTEPSYDYVADEATIHQTISALGGKRVEGSEWFQVKDLGIEGVIDIIKSRVTLT